MGLPIRACKFVVRLAFSFRGKYVDLPQRKPTLLPPHRMNMAVYFPVSPHIVLIISQGPIPPQNRDPFPVLELVLVRGDLHNVDRDCIKRQGVEVCSQEPESGEQAAARFRDNHFCFAKTNKV